jgi:hypothetical protein
MPLSALTPAPARMKIRSVGKTGSINGSVQRLRTFPDSIAYFFSLEFLGRGFGIFVDAMVSAQLPLSS